LKNLSQNNTQVKFYFEHKPNSISLPKQITCLNLVYFFLLNKLELVYELLE